MRVLIRQKNLEITPALRIYLESKVLKPIHRLLKGAEKSALPVLTVEVGRTTRRHRKGAVYHTAASFAWDGALLHAEAEDEDIRAACDRLEEELEREILTYKGRTVALEKRGARRAKEELRLNPAARFSTERASPMHGRAARFRRGTRVRDEGN